MHVIARRSQEDQIDLEILHVYFHSQIILKKKILVVKNMK